MATRTTKIDTSSWSARDVAKLILEQQGVNTPHVILAALVIAESSETIARSLTSIARGDVHGPEGLEMLAMAIGGEGVRRSLAESLDGVASAVADVARAVDERK